MSHRGPKRRSKIGGQFSARLIEMIEAPAYKVLSLGARRVIDRIEIEMAHHGGMDNGRLPITYDQFQDYGIDRHAIAPAIREVCALGFVEITEPGRAGNAEWRRPNLFRLTYRQVGNAPSTHEWKGIKTECDAERIAREARQPVCRKIESQWGKTPVFSGGRAMIESW